MPPVSAVDGTTALRRSTGGRHGRIITVIRTATGFALVVAATLSGPPHARAADVLHVANVSRTLFSLPLWVAQRQGFVKDERLDTTSHILDNAEKINAALRSGKMQLAMGTPEAVVMDAYKAGTLRMIAGNTGRLPNFIITKPEIKTLAQLRGANIGILSEKEGSTYVVQDIAKAIGLTPADYKMTVVGGTPTRWRLLKEGKIDAGLQPFPLSYEAEAAGFNNLARLSRSCRIGSSPPSTPTRNGQRRTAMSWCDSCARCNEAATS